MGLPIKLADGMNDRTEPTEQERLPSTLYKEPSMEKFREGGKDITCMYVRISA